MSLSDLKAGQRTKVTQEFLDFDGQKIAVDSQWTFREYNYFPYDGGYTFYFEEGVIRLAEIDDANNAVLNSFSSYFILLESKN
jgi:Domain of unknown function (DUF3601)